MSRIKNLEGRVELIWNNYEFMWKHIRAMEEFMGVFPDDEPEKIVLRKKKKNLNGVTIKGVRFY